jgi:hypothetical protein
MFALHRQIPHLWWFVDGANRGAVNECKSRYGERTDWEKAEDLNPEDNHVMPVSFGKEHKQMLQQAYQFITNGKIAIPREYQKLVNALRTAWAIEFDLDKEQTMDDDHLDAMRLMLKGVKEDNIDDE